MTLMLSASGVGSGGFAASLDRYYALPAVSSDADNEAEISSASKK